MLKFLTPFSDKILVFRGALFSQDRHLLGMASTSERSAYLNNSTKIQSYGNTACFSTRPCWQGDWRVFEFSSCACSMSVCERVYLSVGVCLSDCPKV